MGCSNGKAFTTNQYALVSYIPDPLGVFLDRLRLELVPGCSPHAHVTILPPRPICASQEQAASEIMAEASDVPGFEVVLGNVEVFPVSKVIYIGLKQGEEQLREMYRMLNRGAVAYDEPFPYHPHVTLAQNFPLDQVDRLHDLASRRWAEYKHTRRFTVDALDFVKNLYGNSWADLTNVHLKKPTLV